MDGRGKIGTLPIPRWMDDVDYFSIKDPKRKEHVAAIERRKRLNTKCSAASGDGSYSIVLERK